MQTRGSFFGMMPPVTKNLIIINLIVWLAMFVLPNRVGIFELHYFSASDFNPVQLLSYMFMHDTSNFIHIFFNMFSLWMFGMTLERTLGSARFLFYYISCGVGAALVQELVWMFTLENSLINYIASQNGVDFSQAKEMIDSTLYGQVIINTWFNNQIVIGASGAIYGVLLAFGMLFPNAPLYLFFIPVPIKAKWMVLGMGAIEVLIGLSEAAGRGDGIAHFAHLGGMIFGFLIILYWKKKGLFNGGYGNY